MHFLTNQLLSSCWSSLLNNNNLSLSFKDIINMTISSLNIARNLIKQSRRWSTSYKANPIIKPKAIESVLIANRGEIACRVIRTAKRMGVRTVAVFSEVDAQSLHVKMADEAVLLGPALSSLSYLNQEKIIQVAKMTGAESIHPGYGFLSENASFAKLCHSNNIVFIGPPSDAITKMGSKSESKEIMSKAAVPVVPGYHGSQQDNDDLLLEEASKIGFPVMIKAVAGGGGKGMRISLSHQDFMENLKSARRESLKSFGDDSVLVEKFVVKPRHIEVQVFGDLHGNYVSLFERDCSVQRRHQKILEEAPAPGIDDQVRQKLYSNAVKAAAAVNYVGAGTVEFIYQESSKEVFFMEMNTRLQVEHPVTEFITGTDLVEWQLRVASGEVLPMTQEEIDKKGPLGHAFEARVYAEDTSNGSFIPAPGPLNKFFVDDETLSHDNSIRVETGVRSGDEVSIHYDSMIAKLVVCDQNREKSIKKLQGLLSSTRIHGVKTNVDFLMRLLNNQDLRDGKVNTDFIEDHRQQVLSDVIPDDDVIAAAAVGRFIQMVNAYQTQCPSFAKDYDSFRVCGSSATREEFLFKYNDHEYKIVLQTLPRSTSYSVSVDGKETGVFEGCLDESLGRLTITKNGHRRKYGFISSEDSSTIFTGNPDLNSITLEVVPSKFLTSSIDVTSDASSSGRISSPMPGVIDNILVKEGQTVKAGDPLLTLIAMKMEYTLKSPRDGTVQILPLKVGENVSKGEVLAVVKSDQEA